MAGESMSMLGSAEEPGDMSISDPSDDTSRGETLKHNGLSGGGCGGGRAS